MKEATATASRGLERASSQSRSSTPTAAPPGKNIITIALRELRAYFDSLVAYVVLGGSLLGLGIWFFLFQGGFWQVDRATMSRMFEFMPWAFAFLVIPLITMRALAEETRSGTMELLITLPVTDADVILGKYFAALLMAFILLLSTAAYPIAMFVWPWHLGALDWGPVWAGYLGLFLFSAAGIAVGLLFSSLTESQIIAFFMTAFVLVLMQIVGWLVQFVPGVVGDSIAFVSFSSRYEPFARGLIDTRAVIYFISVAVLCLLIAFRSLESRKWS
jgi:ABC-2 type transport system permease protein